MFSFEKKISDYHLYYAPDSEQEESKSNNSINLDCILRSAILCSSFKNCKLASLENTTSRDFMYFEKIKNKELG